MKPIKWINGLILAAIGLVSAGWAQAAPIFTVNSTADVAVDSGALDNGICETATGNGVCTLRSAIIKANHWPGGGVSINLPALPPGGKYLLTIPPSGIDDETTGNLNITGSMNISGGGAANTIIEGNSVGSTFGGVVNISAGAVNTSGVTIQNGRAGDGGGISVDSNGRLTLTSSTVSGNSCANFGGGIYNSGSLTLINSTISGNRAIREGGGIENINNGSLTITNTSISGNSVDVDGGGILNNFGTLTITNSTISGNSAGHDGGGVHNLLSAAIFNSTITLNRAAVALIGGGTGGGVFNSPTASFFFKNSIIANNSFLILVPGDCAGTLTSQGFNIVSTPNCTIIGPFSQVDPLLGPLQNNGGPTQTHALLSGSPAIDAGEIPSCTDNLGAPITNDQRGAARAVGPACDIGAVEYGALLPLLYLPLISR